jgi:hypothetical protein
LSPSIAYVKLIDLELEGAMPLKIKKSSVPSLGGLKAESSSEAKPIEPTEQVEKNDHFERYEGGGGSQSYEPETTDEEMEQWLDESVSDPQVAREVTWPVLLGQEQLPAHVASTLTGVANLMDDREDPIALDDDDWEEEP